MYLVISNFIFKRQLNSVESTAASIGGILMSGVNLFINFQQGIEIDNQKATIDSLLARIVALETRATPTSSPAGKIFVL